MMRLLTNSQKQAIIDHHNDRVNKWRGWATLAQREALRFRYPDDVTVNGVMTDEGMVNTIQSNSFCTMDDLDELYIRAIYTVDDGYVYVYCFDSPRNFKFNLGSN